MGRSKFYRYIVGSVVLVAIMVTSVMACRRHAVQPAPESRVALQMRTELVNAKPLPATETSTSVATQTVLPTATATMVSTQVVADVVQVAVVSAETISTEQPTATPAATKQPQLTPTPPPTATQVKTIFAEAISSAWMQSSLDEEVERWLGYYLSLGMQVETVGRSKDGKNLHIVHPDGINGWVAMADMKLVNAEIDELRVSGYSELAWNVIGKPTLGAEVEVEVQRPSPTNTPWPARTSQPTKPSNLPPATAWPTRTPWPTKTALPTPWPTDTVAPIAGPTKTATPQPTAQPQAPAAPPQNEPIVETNAIAWWHLDQGSVAANGDGTWRADLIVRVPTSFTYSFELANLTRTTLQERNVEGDDYFVLTMWGADCGGAFSAELHAYQNGAKMLVQNEFTLVTGQVFINPPC